ncbi:MAG: hypothetical protein DMF76_04065 [Acidobacteria bacterium]|nr:MAG: hypothetical protein DMF76_04065 [Acidobacteriota bacterium]
MFLGWRRLSGKQTRYQQERKRTNYFRRRRSKKIGEPYVDATSSHSDGVVQPGVRIKSYLDLVNVGREAMTPTTHLAKRVAKSSLEM